MKRRDFVRSSLGVTLGAAVVGVPALGAQSTPATSDPVLEALLAEIDALRFEGEANPAKRKNSMQGTEVLLGVLAAHMGQHDAAIKAGIRRLGRDRRSFVQEVATKLNKPEFTHDRIEAAIKTLEAAGLKGILRDARKAIKSVRDNAPNAMLVKTTQWDGCPGLQFQMELMVMMAGIACTLSVAFAGANVAADGACITMGTLVVMMQAVLWWYGC